MVKTNAGILTPRPLGIMGSLIPQSDRKPLGKRKNKKQETRRRKTQRELCSLRYKTENKGIRDLDPRS